MLQGAIDTFAADASRLETDSFVLAVKQVGGTRDLVLQATIIQSADNWHGRMGHINAKRLDFLNKTAGNGMRFVGEVPDYDVRAIGKSTQRAHPTKASLNVSNRFGQVYTEFMRPILPTSTACRQKYSSSRPNGKQKTRPSLT